MMGYNIGTRYHLRKLEAASSPIDILEQCTFRYRSTAPTSQSGQQTWKAVDCFLVDR